MSITLHNLTDWRDADIKLGVSQIAEDLKLKGDIMFVFQATWTEIDDYGEVLPGTEEDIGFDGDAYDNGVVRVCVGKLQYPFAYDINDQLEGFYLRHIVEIRDAYEMFLYMTAHELRHLWQWEHPDKARQIRRLLKCDDETDADVYAMMTLSRYRSRLGANL
jgi:hypothetical protein